MILQSNEEGFDLTTCFTADLHEDTMRDSYHNKCEYLIYNKKQRGPIERQAEDDTLRESHQQE
jgi:hypothetical protein